MNIKDQILNICQGNNTDRFKKICSILEEQNINYLIQTDVSCYKNIVIPSSNNNIITLSAHYDVFPNSLGYNDNTSGVVAVLNILDKLPSNIEVVFTDGEETGYKGAKLYKLYTNKYIVANVNVDVCGLDGVIYLDNSINCLDKCLNNCMIGIMPGNDGEVFRKYNVPSITLSTSKKNVEFKDGIKYIGSTIHNHENDNNIDLISEKSIINTGKKILQIIKEINTKNNL